MAYVAVSAAPTVSPSAIASSLNSMNGFRGGGGASAASLARRSSSALAFAASILCLRVLRCACSSSRKNCDSDCRATTRGSASVFRERSSPPIARVQRAHDAGGEEEEKVDDDDDASREDARRSIAREVLSSARRSSGRTCSDFIASLKGLKGPRYEPGLNSPFHRVAALLVLYIAKGPRYEYSSPFHRVAALSLNTRKVLGTNPG